MNTWLHTYMTASTNSSETRYISTKGTISTTWFSIPKREFGKKLCLREVFKPLSRGLGYITLKMKIVVYVSYVLMLIQKKTLVVYKS